MTEKESELKWPERNPTVADCNVIRLTRQQYVKGVAITEYSLHIPSPSILQLSEACPMPDGGMGEESGAGTNELSGVQMDRVLCITPEQWSTDSAGHLLYNCTRQLFVGKYFERIVPTACDWCFIVEYADGERMRLNFFDAYYSDLCFHTGFDTISEIEGTAGRYFLVGQNGCWQVVDRNDYTYVLDAWYRFVSVRVDDDLYIIYGDEVRGSMLKRTVDDFDLRHGRDGVK